MTLEWQQLHLGKSTPLSEYTTSMTETLARLVIYTCPGTTAVNHQPVPQNLTFYGEMVALTEREEYNKTQT